jgi:uncharacterized protein with FMN-binding domain
MSKRSSASLGRRLLPAVAMTTAASGLVAVLDRPPSGTADDDVGADAAELPDQGAVMVASEPPVVSSALPAVVDQPSSTSVPPATGPLQQPVSIEAPVATDAPITEAPAVETPAGAAPACDGQPIDGPTINTIWGPVQLEAVLTTDGQICDIIVLRSPDDRRKSRQINEDALPILHTQVINAQSTKIKGVSGATVTKQAYVRSLQAVLDGVAGVTTTTIDTIVTDED